MNNVSGSPYERHVDNFMADVQGKVNSLLEYTNTAGGKALIINLGSLATIGSAAVLGFASPLTVLVSAVAGVVMKSFSGDQAQDVGDKLGKITEKLSGSVKMLAVIITMTYAPVLFPVTAGLYLGLEFGPSVDPKALAGLLDRARESIDPNYSRTNGSQTFGGSDVYSAT